VVGIKLGTVAAARADPALAETDPFELSGQRRWGRRGHPFPHLVTTILVSEAREFGFPARMESLQSTNNRTSDGLSPLKRARTGGYAALNSRNSNGSVIVRAPRRASSSNSEAPANPSRFISSRISGRKNKR